MTIYNIAHRQPAFAPAYRLNSLTTKKLPAFSIQEHAPAAPQSAAPARQVIAASLSSRQVPGAASGIAAATPASTAPHASANAPQAQTFFVANPNYDASDPYSSMLAPDTTATATPQRVQFKSADGLITTGIMNPFGLTKNSPSIGYFGAEPSLATFGLARS